MSKHSRLGDLTAVLVMACLLGWFLRPSQTPSSGPAPVPPRSLPMARSNTPVTELIFTAPRPYDGKPETYVNAECWVRMRDTFCYRFNEFSDCRIATLEKVGEELWERGQLRLPAAGAVVTKTLANGHQCAAILVTHESDASIQHILVAGRIDRNPKHIDWAIVHFERWPPQRPFNQETVDTYLKQWKAWQND